MPELMSDAINLMLIGMGFVFTFLTILVFVTSTMSKIVARYVPVAKSAPLTVSTGSKLSKNAEPVSSRDARLVAVISAAITRYRTQHKHEHKQ